MICDSLPASLVGPDPAITAEVGLELPPDGPFSASYRLAEKELMSLNSFNTPTDKLVTLDRCVALIESALCSRSEILMDDSLDELPDWVKVTEGDFPVHLPSMVWILIRANPQRLQENISAVRDYAGAACRVRRRTSCIPSAVALLLTFLLC